MFIDKKNILDNVCNKIQAESNIIIYIIFHTHLQWYYVKILRWKPAPPRLFFCGYCPV